MPGDGGVRAGDRDREAVVELLQEAYVAGCLDVGELRSRAGAAYLARTWGELRALTSDLPARPAVPGPRRSHSPALLPLILLGCLGIAIIAQWPATLIPVIVLALPVLAARLRGQAEPSASCQVEAMADPRPPPPRACHAFDHDLRYKAGQPSRRKATMTSGRWD